MAEVPKNIADLMEKKARLGAELNATVAELKAALDDHYRLIGRFVVMHRGRRFRIANIQYTERGSIVKVTGPLVKKDGTDSTINGYAFRDWQGGPGDVEGLEPL